MTVEPLGYRARKWLVQQVTGRLDRGTQHQRLLDEEWDVALVLDACRWDTLDDVADWPIDHAYSPGSATPQWLDIAERTRVLEDTYVVSANAQYDGRDLGEAELHAVWETDWNARLGTVLPEPTLSKADDLLADGKRPVVAHLLPPHAPYVAKVADTWLPAFPDTDVWDRNPNVGEQEGRMSPQVAMARGHIDLDRARRAYEASVASTWAEVADWVGRWVDRELTVVVTADHGETFGRLRDFGFCGHPNRCHVDPLVKVPYERFEQRAPAEGGAESVEEKLSALGYV
ncbi:hypothetical protein [Halosimplex marinum]|uniref:hypothetical protein n=1 Tax=Halosimplex marinum TaxID=3396620 RepID=UPI003F54AE1C